MARSTRRRTSGKANVRLLEHSFSGLYMHGYQKIVGKREYTKRADQGTLPPRYIAIPFAQRTIYGTQGRKEALIGADGTTYIFEAKWQDANGSVDEKMPFLWESFLASEHHWIVRCDGFFWRRARGAAAVAWLRQRIATSNDTGRAFYVVVRDDEWNDLAKKLFL